MKCEIIEPDGDLKREVWTFILSVDYGRACIYLENYAFQTRDSIRRRKWESQTHWGRHFRRENNIDNPPLPPSIESQMRSHYQEYIMSLSIIK